MQHASVLEHLSGRQKRRSSLDQWSVCQSIESDIKI